MAVHEFPPRQITTTDHHDHQTLNGDLDTKQAAPYIGVSTAQLEKWRHLGGGPDYIRYGRRCIRYRLADLDAFRNKHRQEG